VCSLQTSSLIYTKTTILPVVLCGYENWSLTLREKQTLRLFENRVLWRIFGTKREEVAGGWRRLHNEELHNIYEGVSKSFRIGHLERGLQMVQLSAIRCSYIAIVLLLNVYLLLLFISLWTQSGNFWIHPRTVQ
jgi:hypothetical protein